MSSMSEHEDKQLLVRWMRAEAGAADEEAERGLARLLAVLPAYRPRPGFARKVLAAAGVAGAAPPPPRWLRWAALAVLVSMGLTIPLAREGLWQLGRWIGLADLLATATLAFLSFLRSLDLLMAVLGFFASVREGLLTVLASPPVAAALAGMAVVAILAFRWLSALLASEGRRSYA